LLSLLVCTHASRASHASYQQLTLQKEDCGCGFFEEVKCSAEVAACAAACTGTLGAACAVCVAKMSFECCLCLADLLGAGGCVLCDCGCKDTVTQVTNN
jgi:hypothetical protein